MGKKRSKVAKQKQAKQSKRSFGGVTMTKATGGRSNVGTTTTMLLGQSPKIPPPSAKKRPHLKRNFPKGGKPSGSKKSNSGRNHNDNFDREMHSLQQRVAQHEYFKTAHQQRNKKSHRLSEATIVVDDKKKSTQRLVNEAIEKISNFGGFGAAFPTKTPHPSPRSPHILQTMAAEQRSRWKMEAAERVDNDEKLESNNPWSALQQDGGEDDDSLERPAKKSPFACPAFDAVALAAPTFTVEDTTIDPDL